jgi:hypothetical protein
MTSDGILQPGCLSDQEIGRLRKNLALKSELPQIAREKSRRQVERRKSTRWSYPVIEQMAPCRSRELPSKSLFRAVRCHDISSGGISFFLPEPPDFERAVVTLGPPPDVICFLVRVVHYSPRKVAVRNQHLVRCRFFQRVTIPS